MRLLKCLFYQNDCYENYHNYRFAPEGIVVHSTAPAGKILKRFVQPYAGQTDGMEIDGVKATEAQMRAILGKNQYNNDWNRHQTKNPACVHAFIGQLEDGSYATVQTLPWDMPCWGAGSGKNGSYNGCLGGKARKPLYIQFEQIEDTGTPGDKLHCEKMYNQAVNLCAYLMKLYPTIKLENVVSHKEACARGYATDHGDPENYWRRCGVDYTMAKFRKDVQKCLEGEIFMTQAELKQLISTEVKAAVDSKMAEYEKKSAEKTEAQAKAAAEAAVTAADGKWIERIGDIPHPAVAEEMRELLDCGAVNGGTVYEEDPDDIRLPYNMVRVLVMAMRYVKQAIAK